MSSSIRNIFISKDTDKNAKRLLGCELIRYSEAGIIRGIITEVESYDQHDTSSHSFGRITKRNQVMYGHAEHAYVYLSYGMHYCLNIVSGPENYGAGILVRSVKITQGLELARQIRGERIKDSFLSNGPGKVGKLLGINLSLYGHDLEKPPLQLIINPRVSNIVSTPRIGISKNKEALRRFYIE